MSDHHPESGNPEMEPRPDVLAPAPAPARRPLAKTVLTAMAGLLVVGAVGFAVVTLREGDGSASAESAVERLFEAVDRQDAIGIAESLEPSEQRIVVSALEEAADQAKRVKVTNGALDLHQVEGVDLSVEDLKLTTTPLDDETYAVDITSGRVSSRTQLSKMPIGPVVQEVIDRNEDAGEEVDDTSTDEIQLAGTRIVAVERGGEWYVSALFSLAEQVRQDLDPVAAYPKAGSAIPAVGADSPEAAVREGVAAAVDADVRRLIELTPAEEARVLHTYGPILVDQAKGKDPNITVDDLKLKVSDASDGHKKVSATSLTMTIESDWDRQVTTYDGTCTTTTWKVTDPEAYGYEDVEQSEQTWKQCDDPASTLTPFGFFSVFSAPANLDVIVEEHDGKWFLSPALTAIENTVGVTKGLDVDTVRRIARAWGGEWWLYESPEIWKACGVSEPTLDDSRADAEAAWERCMESLPDDYAGAGGPIIRTSDSGSDSFDVGSGEIDPTDTASYRCLQILDEISGLEDLPADEAKAQIEEATARYESCMEQAGAGESSSNGGVSFGSGTTATTAPAPSTPSTTRPSTTATTRPPATTTTTAPPATATTTQP